MVSWVNKYLIPFMMTIALGGFITGCGAGGGSSDQAGQVNTPLTQTAMPVLQDAGALSNHYVEINFAQPASNAAAKADTYSISGPDGETLAVMDAQLNNDRTKAVLTTDAQKPVTYTLTVPETNQQATLLPADAPRRMATRVLSAALSFTTIAPAEAAPANATTSNTITFEGSGQPEPFLQTAIALSNTSVLLTFSERMDQESAETRTFYRIVAADDATPANDVGDLVITSAVLGDDETTVLLTTSAQLDIEYTVIVTNVESRAGGHLINPFRNTTTFFGIPAVDSTGSRLLNAVSTSNTSVQLAFSEPLREATVATPSFALCATDFDTTTLACPDGAQLAITDSQLSAQGTQVTLTTLPQVGGLSYTVRVNDVTDRATPAPGNVLQPNPSFATFPGTGQGAPTLVSAIALDNESVLLTFSERMDDSILNQLFYSIAAPDLAIFSVAREDETKVRLQTSPQSNVEYTVRATNVTSQEGIIIDVARNSTTFFGIATADGEAPQLLSAATTSSTTVLLSFSEALADSAADPINYTICTDNLTPCPSGSQLVITEAKLTAAETQVILTTLEQQPGVRYTVFASNVHDRATPPPGNLIDPNPSSATFGLLLGDNTPPQLTAAVSTGPNSVLLSFSEVLRSTASDPLHFSITDNTGGSLVVTAGALSEHGTQVQLSTLQQVEGVLYTVTVNTVQDLAGNTIDPNPSSATFAFDSIDTGDGGNGDSSSPNSPRVVGAISTGNTTMQVHFDTAMSDNVLTAGHYSIVQESVNSEVGALLVLPDPAPRFVNDATRTTVELTTSSQNEVTYRVFVVGVTDLNGNALVPAVSATGVPNPTSAVFAGTPPSGAQFVDTDGDGLSDNSELRGYVVSVILADGRVTSREVTSDPSNPDTDGDGINDFDEKQFLCDPRSKDTDSDGLNDFQELNHIFSN